MDILTDREKKLVLVVGGLQEALLQARQDLHWTHGMLDTFGACSDRRCASARKAADCDLGPYGQDLNQSVNLWNDLGTLRDFTQGLIARIETLPAGLSPETDALRKEAVNVPFGLAHGSS